jgi:hypothetical protein
MCLWAGLVVDTRYMSTFSGITLKEALDIVYDDSESNNNVTDIYKPFTRYLAVAILCSDPVY